MQDSIIKAESLVQEKIFAEDNIMPGPDEVVERPWDAAWGAYLQVFSPMESLFWVFLFGVLVTVTYMKTKNVSTPLVVLVLLSGLASGLAGGLGSFFKLLGGLALGALMYRAWKRSGR